MQKTFSRLATVANLMDFVEVLFDKPTQSTEKCVFVFSTFHTQTWDSVQPDV